MKELERNNLLRVKFEAVYVEIAKRLLCDGGESTAGGGHGKLKLVETPARQRHRCGLHYQNVACGKT
jgi:hypothetical protein